MSFAGGSNRSLRILSLDGGGIRGISSLLILEHLMEEVRKEQGLEYAMRPCEFFDLIGGTSTGGLIAIMLGRLRMTVEECIQEYRTLAEEAFTPKKKAILPARPRGAFSATALEHAVKATCKRYCTVSECVQQRQHGIDHLTNCSHEDLEFSDERCTKTVVLAVTKDNVDASPTLFTTYDTSAQFRGCTVWQVARATSAATTFFKPIQVGRDKIEFVDAGFGYNNPCEVLIAEAQRNLPAQHHLQILSIGTGSGDPASIGDTRMDIVNALKCIVTSSNQVATRVDERYGDTHQYFRFNVDKGLEDIVLSDWKESSQIAAHTINYIRNQRRTIKAFVQQFTSSPQTRAPPSEGENATRSEQIAQTTTVHLITLPQNKHFVDRPERQRLLQLLLEPSKHTAAVWGLGGVGKTQLAVSATQWIKAEKMKWSIFWVPAYSYAGFEKAFLDIARAIGVPPTREDKDFKSSVRRMLSSDRFGPWLLVVDNADDLNVLHGREGREGILQYLPQSIHGYMLFTTRSRDVALHVADDAILQLTPMAPGEAEELLRKSLHQERHPSDPGLTKALLDSLANIPLAIIQASAYLNRNIDVSIERYLQKLRSNEETLATIMNQDFYDLTRYSDLQNAIVGTWLLSFEQILRVDTYASYLLRFISCIEPVAIPMSILPDLGPNTDLDHAIGTLRSYAFLDRTNEEGFFEMHKLVHTVTRLWVRSQQLAVEASQQAIDHFGYTFPSADYRNRSAWRQYIPHTLKALACASDIPWDTCSQLYMLIGQCLRADGHFSGAIRSMECCVSLQDHLPFTHVSKLNAQFQLAISYDEAGRSREAIPLLEHVVKVRRDLVGKEAQQDYLTARQTLAGAYQANGRLVEAITILEDVAKTRENVVPNEKERHLSTLHDLAGAYLAGGRVKESITMLELVVSERLETHPRDHPELLAAQHVLASAYLADARIDRAIELLEYIGDIEEQTLDKDHPDRLESQHVLASAYLADGQVDRATSLLEFVVEKQQALGEEHPSLLCSQHALAQAYQRAGRHASAIELLQKVVRVEEMALSADHPSRIESQKELARAQARHTALNES